MGQSGLISGFFCVNEGTVIAINSGTSRSSHTTEFLRHLVLQYMCCNCLFWTKHVPVQHNSIVDALSRNQVQRFRQLASHANPCPVTISKELSIKLKN